MDKRIVTLADSGKKINPRGHTGKLVFRIRGVWYSNGMKVLPDLPVGEVLPAIKKALEENNQLILEAPPGAGKTTLVPLFLLEETWLKKNRILILEPRRLAARNAAAQMASLLEEDVGERVGYRVRMEKRISQSTRIEVLTEGILSRIIQKDPSLEGIGVLIFDEFHERSLHADLALALALEVQETLREDLKIIVMSATLNSRGLKKILPRGARVCSRGRAFPVTTVYTGRSDERIEADAFNVVMRAIDEQEGGILLFLPGAGEIRRTLSMLENRLQRRKDILLAPLYGALSWEEQIKAVAPPPEGIRKIVLATSIAESSLTIEGICVVIDGGLMRVPLFDSLRGMDRLETITLTSDAADQRRGRAGRLGPGVCYRLWSEAQRLVEHRPPEILHADLAAFALELALWGRKSPKDMAFIDLPGEKSFQSSRELLQKLEALDSQGEITSRGRKMAGMPLHPRLAHMILESGDKGYTACLLGSLLSEGDILRDSNADVTIRLEILQRRGGPGAHRGMVERVLKGAEELKRFRLIKGNAIHTASAGELLALAYPDRIGKRKAPGVYQMVNGVQARLAEDSFARDYIVAALLGGQGPFIFLAAPYNQELLEERFPLEEHVEIIFDEKRKRCQIRKRSYLGRLLIKESPVSTPSGEMIREALLDYIRRKGLAVLSWDKKSESLLQRMRFVALQKIKNFPSFDEEELLGKLDQWLAPWLTGASLDLPLFQPLLSLLSREQQQILEKEAPSHITVPTGSRIPVDYSTPGAPVLAVRLQEIFGLMETPKVGGIPLTLHLLSPAHRPLQITKDLAGFWAGSYQDVKKEMKGRYPKHYWPDDPAVSLPTRRTKNKM